MNKSKKVLSGGQAAVRSLKKEKVNEETEINDEESLSVEMDIDIPPSSSEETKNL